MRAEKKRPMPIWADRADQLTCSHHATITYDDTIACCLWQGSFDSHTGIRIEVIYERWLNFDGFGEDLCFVVVTGARYIWLALWSLRRTGDPCCLQHLRFQPDLRGSGCLGWRLAVDRY